MYLTWFPLSGILAVSMNAASEPHTKAMIGTRNFEAKLIKYLAATHPIMMPSAPIMIATTALFPPLTWEL